MVVAELDSNEALIESNGEERSEGLDYNKIITSSPDNRTVIIDFSTLFNQEIEDYMGEFNISKKRKYPEYMDMILSELRYYSSKVDDLLYAIAGIKYDIVTRVSAEENYTRREFVKDVVDQLITPEMIQAISDKVNSEYTINLDGNGDEDVVNEELQITDAHNKAYLMSSVALRVCIPILLEYQQYYTDKIPDDIVKDTLYHIFNKFEERDILYNKLYKFIDSRVYATDYSDKKMWKILTDQSLTIDIAVRTFMIRVAVNIFPKMLANTSMVALVSVVIKHQISFFFRQKFPLVNRSLNLNLSDGDGLTQFDRLESSMIRINEGKVIINKLAVKDEIKRFAVKIGLSDLTHDEFLYYKDNIQPNRIQHMLMNLFFSRKYGSFTIGYYSDFNTYILGIISLKKWLDVNNFEILSKYLMGKPDRHIERKSINRRKFLERLEESKSFQSLVNDKYKFTRNLIEESSIINRVIGTLASNNFKTIPEYHDYSDGTEILGEDFEYPIENISIEILRFISII